MRKSIVLNVEVAREAHIVGVFYINNVDVASSRVELSGLGLRRPQHTLRISHISYRIVKVG
jgi:hypothetical protein